MKAVISGASGFIGSRLKAHLESLNWEVVALGRKEFQMDENLLSNLMEGCDVIINLAGVPIITRHTDRNRKLIFESRINTTLKLISAIKHTNQKPKQLISASAVGIYSETGVNSESTNSFASGFVAHVVKEWENAARKVESPTLLTIVRIGIVLDGKQGALPTMMLPFKLYVGGNIGSGKQMVSWIHIDDLIRAFMFIIETRRDGVYNFTSPGYISNAEITVAIAKALHRPAFFTVPSFILKLLYGDGAQILTSGQIGYPERLLKEGFSFQFPHIEGALDDLLTKESRAL